MDFIPGMITLAGWSRAPVGWLVCDGSSYPASKYADLFNVIAFIYGGDGRSTFAVPNLVGRIPLGPGSQPNSSTIKYALGQMGGAAATVLTAANISDHGHYIQNCSFTPATVSGQSQALNLVIPYKTAPTGETDIPVSGSYLSVGTSTVGPVMMYTPKAPEGQMNAAPQNFPVSFKQIAFDIKFNSTNPSGNNPVPTLPPVQAINYFICYAANTGS